MISAKKFLSLFKKSFIVLRKNDPLRLAGATAFFTTFALPPILIIVVQVFGLLFNIENLSEHFFERIAEILGTESTSQIKRTFVGFKSKAQNWWITIGGTVFLAFVSTTLFKIIKDSLNQLWDLHYDSRRSVKAKLENRAVSMVVILLAGLLFIASITADTLQALLGEYLNNVAPITSSVLKTIINRLISILVVTTWFTVLFKVLPDANPSWKVVIIGGFVTGILFTIGKNIIPKLLPIGELTSIFGTSSSIVLLLLFVFYSSFILYFGACFTKVYAEEINEPIKLAENHNFW